MLDLGLAASVGLALLGAACRPDDQRTGTVERTVFDQARSDWPVGMAPLVDSGNAAYRAHDFEGAVTYYRRASELGTGIAAPWFGIYMAEKARGNAAAADSALERVRTIAPGASLLVPPADTSR